MEINTIEKVKSLVSNLHLTINNLKMLNIMVLGRAGAGKSTLINSVFRKEIAKTGVGYPVTDRIRKYTIPSVPLCIYDTPGLEMDKSQRMALEVEVIDTIKTLYASGDINKKIHCIWYCINVESNRIDPAEIQWLRTLADKIGASGARVPVVIILTQAWQEEKVLEMMKLIKRENLPVIQIVPVLAMKYVVHSSRLNNNAVFEPFGLDTLIDIMDNCLPDEIKDTLQNVQKVSIIAKEKRSKAIVAVSVSFAAVAGFQPIPFTDTSLLFFIQLSMIMAISVVYGLEIQKSVLSTLIQSSLSIGTTVLSEQVLASFVKLIPGIGTTVGGAISSAVAVAITAALGTAYIKIMERIYIGDLQLSDLENGKAQGELIKEIRRELKRSSRKY